MKFLNLLIVVIAFTAASCVDKKAEENAKLEKAVQEVEQLAEDVESSTEEIKSEIDEIEKDLVELDSIIK